MQMPDRRMFFQINWGLVLITILLFAVGMVNLYSASGSRIEGGFVLSSISVSSCGASSGWPSW